MNSTLEAYFQDKFQSISSQSLLLAVGSVLKDSKNNLPKSLFIAPFSSKSLVILILKLQNSSKIEDQIRQSRIKAVMNSKKILEAKLALLSQNIDVLQNSEKPVKTNSPQDSHLTTTQNTKKFFDLNKQTEQFLKSQAEKLQRKIKKLEKADLLNADKKKEDREQARKEELERMKQKTEARKKQMEQIKGIQAAVIRKKPLFLKYEEEFKAKIELTELQKRKEELRKKREIFAPISKSGLKQHMKWYEDVKKQCLGRILERVEPARSASVSSMWGKKVLEYDREAEEERQRKIEEKRNLRVNKLKYSELIKELHAPSTPEKLERKRKNYSKSNGKIESIGRIQEDSLESLYSDTSSLKAWKPRKFAPNPLVPSPKPPRAPKPITYPEAKRSTRSLSPLTALQNLSSAPTSLKTLQKLTQKIETIANTQESLIKTKPFSSLSLKKSSSIDEMLLSSIKAKLNHLNSANP